MTPAEIDAALTAVLVVSLGIAAGAAILDVFLIWGDRLMDWSVGWCVHD